MKKLEDVLNTTRFQIVEAMVEGVRWWVSYGYISESDRLERYTLTRTQLDAALFEKENAAKIAETIGGTIFQIGVSVEREKQEVPPYEKI